MPQDSGAAFVVIQHLSPDFKSLMNELLGRRTAMGIYKVDDGMTIAPNSIYLIPPGKNLILQQDRLHLVDRQRRNGTHVPFPIDIFLQSLADHYAERSVGVILSGTGSDGTRGLQDIHQAGGIALAQDPATAEFDGMPRSAIATNVVSQVAAPADLAQMIYHLLQSPLDAQQFREESNLVRTGQQTLQRIISVLAESEQFDFTYYKFNTLGRRIQRRCVIAGFSNLDEYLQYLIDSPEERTLLRSDLLISVTRFFRDPEAWAVLEERILPQTIAAADPGTPLRIWIAACATGEEAYSMAILVHEAIARSGKAIEAKIFATDVHLASLDKASQGIYPESIAGDISEERLQRFFTRRGQHFEVSRQLRELLIFAPHNLVKDASFTRMNLVSCRNVLIYMQPELQQKVLRNLHFALAVRGTLFLGESETLGDLEDEFESLDKRNKIFQKLRDVRLPVMVPGVSPPTLGTRHAPKDSGLARLDPVLSEAFKTFLVERQITSLIIDSNLQLLHVCADPLDLLHVPEGPPTRELTKMLPASLQLPLSAALHRAQRNQQAAQYASLKLALGDELKTVNLKVTYRQSSKVGKAFLLVEFAAEDPREAVPIADNFEPDTEAALRISRLEDELQQTRENLQATIEELETTNEEQQATNEELVASNEELQSTNEELHAVNEELYTVNAEYQSKIQELTDLKNDVDNLLASIDIGVVFLDSDLTIRKFTPAATEALNLVRTDIGRPLAHFSHNLDCPNLMEMLGTAIVRSERIEQEVSIYPKGIQALMRVYPYHSDDGQARGIVLTFIDVSTLKQAQAALQREVAVRQAAEAKLQALNVTLEQQVAARVAELQTTNARLVQEANKRRQVEQALSQSNAELMAMFQAIPDAIVFANSEQRIQMVNSAFHRLFGYGGEAALGEPIRTLFADSRSCDSQCWCWEDWDPSGLEERQPSEHLYRHQDGTEFPGETLGAAVVDESGHKIGVMGLIRDLRDRKAAERKIHRQLMAMEAASVGIAMLNDDRYTYLNAAHARIFGYDNPDSLLGQSWHTLYEPDRVAYIEAEAMPQLQRSGYWQGELLAKHRDGHLFEEELSLILTAEGDLICICRDITERKQLERQRILVQSLTRSNQELEQFAYAASHDLREPLRKVRSFAELLDQTYCNRLDENARTYLGFIVSGVARMEALIQGLLAYSKVGQETAQILRVDLNVVVRGIREDLQLLIAENRAELQVAPLPTVSASEAAMQQLFLNLIGNAIKFRSAAPPLIQIEARQRSQEWLVVVRDNGIGIAPEFQERVFDIFQRLHSRDEYPGTGIGLALCRKIVEDRGGRIWIESELGQGSTFYFTLPLLP